MVSTGTKGRRKKIISPSRWGEHYKNVLSVYFNLLLNHGVLPSEIDRHDLSSFFSILNYDRSDTLVSIDQVGGW